MVTTQNFSSVSYRSQVMRLFRFFRFWRKIPIASFGEGTNPQNNFLSSIAHLIVMRVVWPIKAKVNRAVRPMDVIKQNKTLKNPKRMFNVWPMCRATQSSFTSIGEWIWISMEAKLAFFYRNAKSYSTFHCFAE